MKKMRNFGSSTVTLDQILAITSVVFVQRVAQRLLPEAGLGNYKYALQQHCMPIELRVID